jgi:predicted acetyltransferase
MESRTVSLDVASASDSLVLSNLLELYIHDMSEVFPHVALGADGRFGYRRLPLYWSEPDSRYPFLIRCDGRLAGFALATRGSPAATDPDVLDVAEFFVVRQYRRSGVGRQAAFLLWNTLPGKWTVRVLESNRGAVTFWTGIVSEFSKGTATQSSLPGEPNAWQVFAFDSRVTALSPSR